MGMGRCLVFANRKGGVGKTTTSVNIAAALAHMGHDVLLVDSDPQAHATMSLGISQREVTGDLGDVALGRMRAERARVATYIPRLSVLPASRRLSDFERRYANTVEARGWFQANLEGEIAHHDFTIFDTPPTTQLLTIGALVAGNEVYVPMQAHFLAMEGMIEMTEMVDRVRRHHNAALRLVGVIPTFYEEEASFSHELLHELRSRLGERVVFPPVRLSRALAEAPGHGRRSFSTACAATGRWITTAWRCASAPNCAGNGSARPTGRICITVDTRQPNTPRGNDLPYARRPSLRLTPVFPSPPTLYTHVSTEWQILHTPRCLSGPRTSPVQQGLRYYLRRGGILGGRDGEHRALDRVLVVEDGAPRYRDDRPRGGVW